MPTSAPGISDPKHVSIPAKQHSQVWRSGVALLLCADVTSVRNLSPFYRRYLRLLIVSRRLVSFCTVQQKKMYCYPNKNEWLSLWCRGEVGFMFDIRSFFFLLLQNVIASLKQRQFNPDSYSLVLKKKGTPDSSQALSTHQLLVLVISLWGKKGQ